MATPTTFERQELKYLMTAGQYERLRELMEDYMKPDSFGRSTIHNIYYDTPDSLLVRRSLEKPLYKEKLRVRSYGCAALDGTVYVELKKKFRGIVYKRRVAATQTQARHWLDNGLRPRSGTQIVREIDYFRKLYQPLLPAMLLTYEREAFFGRNDSCFRMTFDGNILWRDCDITLSAPPGGDSLLAPDARLLEVKAPEGLPLWLTRFLSREEIFKASFSKYGNAYLARRRSAPLPFPGTRPLRQQELGGAISA